MWTRVLRNFPQVLVSFPNIKLLNMRSDVVLKKKTNMTAVEDEVFDSYTIVMWVLLPPFIALLDGYRIEHIWSLLG